MRKLTLSLIAGAAAVAFAGAAYAQPVQAPQAPRQEMTRADAAQRADRMFDRLDANHDGKLDEADRQARQKARFDRLDSNHDGQVSYAEFTAAHAKFDQARKDRVGQQGQRLGAPDGERGEHRMGMRRFGQGFAARGGMLRMADADKDGTITKAEFEAAVLQRFDRLDTNKDGVVSRDEAKAARDNMRQQWQSRRGRQEG